MTLLGRLKSEINLMRAIERCQADLRRGAVDDAASLLDRDEFRRELADRVAALVALLDALQRDAAAVWQVPQRSPSPASFRRARAR